MIHPTAIIDPKAQIGTDVSVGPYSVIGADVRVGDGCWIGPHVVIQGPTTLGRENRIFQFASLGEEPQDKKYAGEPTTLEIGDRNTIREGVTINRGTAQDKGYTRLGDDNWIMAYVHIAHDCEVGNNTIFANNASLAGHVEVEDFAILGGFTLVHQFCRIGAHSFTGMNSVISKDVAPYVMVTGDRELYPRGLNSEGLKRRQFSDAALAALKQAYKVIFRSNLPVSEAVAQLQSLAQQHPEVARLLDFINSSQRGIAR